jgi:serine/threonine protein phosphatase 1
MGKTFVLGDIHGAYHALRQCIERSGFQKENDRLIFLGDVCDGWPQTKECVNELMNIPHLVCLLGNHDFWFLNWMKFGDAEDIWLSQGGQATVNSYKEGTPPAHMDFIARALNYFEEGNKLFVHAGVPPGKRAKDCTQHELLWDRRLPYLAQEFSWRKEKSNLTLYEEVFIGHTPISSPHPEKHCEVWMMDIGAGWSGVLSMMNLETHECFMSDPVPTLYPGVKGRERV